jgi:hypothetical protein
MNVMMGEYRMAWAWRGEGHEETGYAKESIFRCIIFTIASSTRLICGVNRWHREFWEDWKT